jgi:DNA-3-methyladenine glycosylase I
MTAATREPDGIRRCPWVGNDLEYQRYHDEEWGQPLHGDRALFEKISLEGFQAGLSWITILKKRDAFRDLFQRFDIDRVAEFDAADVELLLADARIIRNRAKIEAAISNARIIQRLISDYGPGALDDLVWSFAVTPRAARPVTAEDIPTVTPGSVALSKALKKLGLKFVGPTTMYALMQSAGVVDDHVAGCFRATADLSR